MNETISKQHCEHARYDVDPSGPIHEIAITEASTLAGLYGTTHQVNSLHHQTVATLATDLVVTAAHGDGTVEGVEHRSLPMIAVQWHPEMLDTCTTDPLFRWIVDQAMAHAAR